MNNTFSPKRISLMLAVAGGLALQVIPATAHQQSFQAASNQALASFVQTQPSFAAIQADEDEEVADDEIVATVEEEVDDVEASFVRYTEILDELDGATDAESEELLAELLEIVDMWTEYPDVAADIEFPRGYDDLEETYLEFAGLVGDTGVAFNEWIATETDSPESDEAFDIFMTAYEDTLAAIEDVRAAIDDAGTGSSNKKDEEEEEDSDKKNSDEEDEDSDKNDRKNNDDEEDEDEKSGSSDADVAAFASDVQDEIDSVNESLIRFSELLGGLADASDAEVGDMVVEMNEIAASWSEYPETAEALAEDAPAGSEDLVEAYLDYATVVGQAGDAFISYTEALQADDPDASAIWEDEFSPAFSGVFDASTTVQEELDAVSSAGAVYTAGDVRFRIAL